MRNTKDNKSIVGKFIGKYIVLAIIIGGISFFLENLVPQLAHWNLTSTRAIYQSVLFVISTLLTITIAANKSLKDTKFETKSEAKQVVKPIKTLLIFIALLVMIFNLAYCFGIEQSGYKDVEAKYEIGEKKDIENKEAYIEAEKEYVQMFSNIYLASKEIITILTFAYAVIYVEKMVECRVEKPRRIKED